MYACNEVDWGGGNSSSSPSLPFITERLISKVRLHYAPDWLAVHEGLGSRDAGCQIRPFWRMSGCNQVTLKLLCLHPLMQPASRARIDNQTRAHAKLKKNYILFLE
jgi:hypothetical protein